MNTPLRILHIEDDPNDVELVKETLKRGGITCVVRVVETRADFTTALKESGWDLILCDYLLPSFDGFSALTITREKCPEVPFIFVSGKIGEEGAIEALKKGATDYVLKNRLSKLVPAVRRALKEIQEQNERKRAEEQFRLIAENISDLIAVIDLDGKRLYNSPSYKEILGDPETLRGTDSFDEIHPEDRGKVKRIFQETVKTGVGQRAEFRFLCKDGSIRYIESQGGVIRDEKGKVAKVIVVSRDVTERKRIEEALRQSEGKYRTIIENTLDIIYSCSPEGIVTFVSPQVLSYGYSTKEIIGHKISEFMHPDDINKSMNSFQRTMQTGETFPTILRLRRKNGTYMDVEELSKTIKEGDKIVQLTGIIRDITERKRAEEALIDSEERFKILFEYAPDAYYLHDLKGNLVDGNIVAEELTGHKREELVGKNLLEIDLLPLDQIPKATALLKKNAQGLPAGPDEFVLSRKDGKKVSVEVRTLPVKIKGQTLVLGIAHDITNRKRAEEILKASQEYAKNIINSSMDMIIAVDKDREITEFNLAAQETFGYSKEEILGKHVDLLYSDPSQGLKVHEMALVNGRYVQEVINKRKNGELFPSFLSASVLRDARGEVVGVMGVSRDITDRVRQEAERKRLEEQLLQAQKMEAVGRLTGGIAHDFNNMMTAVIGYSSLILSVLKEDDPLKADIEEIKKAGEHAAALTHQLLAFSRKQVLKPQILNLNNLINEVKKMLTRIIGEDIELTTVLEPKIANIQTDQGQIEQVIMNLAVNARDAMPKGGNLTIKSENVTIEEEYCKLNPEARAGKFVRLSVQDAGLGMDKETLNHLFEPFFTTKETGKGTGLGLSTVYGIVKQHNGWLNVYSELGKGTIFKIYLPVFSIEETPETKEETILSEDLKGKGERVLLVENNEGVRNFATKMLTENGYTVFPAENAQETMDIFKQKKGKFDLILTDIVLPDENGFDLVDRLLKHKPKLPAILSSGYLDDQTQLSMIKEKGFKFVGKPYSATALLRTIRELLDK